MNRPANIALLAIVAIAAIAAERAFVSPAPRRAETAPRSDALEGRVISVDPVSNGDEADSLARKARVKLRTGETVSASIGGCVIFPGQNTRLLKYGSGSSAYYVVAENGRNDS